MKLQKVAWRPFWSYRQEESTTKIHLIDVEQGTKKCLCGKEHDLQGGAWGESPAAYQHCKRCLSIARKRGVTNDEIRAMEWRRASGA